MAMPIFRRGVGPYANHDIHPIPIPTFTTLNPVHPPGAGYSSNVYINGLPAMSTGNTCIPHTIPIIPPPPPHPDVLITGHSRVYINGGCAATIGSVTNFGAPMIGSASVTVFMGAAPLATAIVNDDGSVTQPEPPEPEIPQEGT
jgi:uncharacterized Zn-binding protein involved in type VI secretion